MTSPYAAAAVSAKGASAVDDGLFAWQRQRFTLPDDAYWELLNARRGELVEQDLALAPQKVFFLPLFYSTSLTQCVGGVRGGDGVCVYVCVCVCVCV